ncbi:uncharacterized protein LOC123011323 [Tribolium madens]|uniref:uncharacterized protein LOC123011323 n=1 Tax=Tribolium madens TaxID=41895 RepID=UPI001CF75D9E|nr:uncharacterized protein LOC123011323 [Tribolium madens]XP_044264643.1 uncharacterized protein LOC123011323 [Tribolium madens]
MDFDIYVLIPIILAITIMCLLSILRCRRHKKNTVTQMATTNIYTVPANYNAVNRNYTSSPQNPVLSNTTNFGHHRISSQGERFAVPVDLLPPDFDYTAPGVEYKENYVLVKDLTVINKPAVDEYQKQSPYNPNFQ